MGRYINGVGTVLSEVGIESTDFDTPAVDTDEREAPADATYEVRIDGDADHSVDVETFDLVSVRLERTGVGSTMTRRL